MEQRIKQLFRQLSFLGYCTFEIKRIVQEAIGTDNLNENCPTQCGEIILALEKYEQLGSYYLEAYSK